MTNFKDKLLLIDGHALFHRAYHAVPGLTNRTGFPTGAIFGFFSMLFKALSDIKPTHVLVVFDAPGPTFRHKMAADYKATRKVTDDELLMQLPKTKEILKALNIPTYEKPGFEADDILGIIAGKSNPDVFNIIVTGDLDLLQLVNKNTEVYRFKTGFSDVLIYDEAYIKKTYGIGPDQWVDYKALRGDPSDNIPGVKGVGEKTALDLVQKYGDLDCIYHAVEQEDQGIKSPIIKKLKMGKQSAYLSYKLARIDPKGKFDFALKDAKITSYDKIRVVELFEELEIKALNNRLPKNSDTEELGAEPAKLEEKNYQTINSKPEIEHLAKELETSRGFAIKILQEDKKLKGLVFCTKPTHAYFLPVINTDKKTFSLLRESLENPKIEKWGYDLKNTAMALKNYGIDLASLSFDTMIASYLLDPGRRNYIEPPLIKIFERKSLLEKQLKEKNLWNIFTNIEMPLIPILEKMEQEGIKLDMPWLKKLSDEAEIKISVLEKKIYKLAGMEFNVSSPIQLREILFEKLAIPTDTLRKRGKSGGLSTAATSLEKLRGLHPIIDHIFEYRALSKLKSTYLDALPELVSKKDKRLHTTFNQTVAATGRLSSSEPNIQNIPIRTELGSAVRKAFVAEPGYQIVSLDYSQLELRIAASLSGDPIMIEVFKEGGDFHNATASKIFDVEESMVTKEQRRDAKTINFSVLYGVSAFGLSERSEMSRPEAGQFIKKYFVIFKRLKQYLDELTESVHKTGFTMNPLGRIRYFPEIHNSNFAIRAAAERAAVNMPMQSLAADILKMAMIKIFPLTDADCRMLLSVHDELVFEIKSEKISDYVPKIKEAMQNIYKLKVPLTVEAKVGPNWLETKKSTTINLPAL